MSTVQFQVGFKSVLNWLQIGFAQAAQIGCAIGGLGGFKKHGSGCVGLFPHNRSSSGFGDEGPRTLMPKFPALRPGEPAS